MSSTLSATQFEFPVDRMPAEPSVDTTAPLAADLQNDRFLSEQPSWRKRGLLAVVRFLIAACIGGAATLAWQSYGEEARQVIASSSQQLGWLAPRAEAVTPAEPDTIASATPSADQQQLESISLDLAAVRQSVDQLIASQDQITRRVDQLALGQDQMTRDIAKLQQFQQYILYKTSEPPPQPAPVPARRPVPTPVPAPPPALPPAPPVR
jgi:hypothetical protein